MNKLNNAIDFIAQPNVPGMFKSNFLVKLSIKTNIKHVSLIKRLVTRVSPTSVLIVELKT